MMRLLVAATVVAISSAALAETRPAPSLPQFLNRVIVPGQVRNGALKEAGVIWDGATNKALKISNDEVELYLKMLGSSSRARRFADVFKSDLDGDGVITREEYDRVANFKGQALGANFTVTWDKNHYISQYDLNGDGKITFDEFLRYSNPITVAEQHNYETRMKAILALAPGKDGEVTKEQFVAGVAAIFDTADRDKNGVLDLDEMMAMGWAYRTPQFFLNDPF